MKIKKNLLFIAIPVIALASWAAYHEIRSNIGETVFFKIEGYDPRDLLSGHYLEYRVKYDNFAGRNCYTRSSGDVDYLCVDTGEVNGDLASCRIKIKGRCTYWGFTAGIERYYIPQEHAQTLEKILMSDRYEAHIKVLVTKSGTAYVKGLYFDDIPWKELIKDGDAAKPNAPIGRTVETGDDYGDDDGDDDEALSGEIEEIN